MLLCNKLRNLCPGFQLLILPIPSLLQAVIFHVKRGPFKQEFYQCVTHGSYTHHWQEQLYSALSLLFMFIIPLTIMVVSYGLIFCTIARKSRNYNGELNLQFSSCNQMRFASSNCRVMNCVLSNQLSSGHPSNTLRLHSISLFNVLNCLALRTTCGWSWVSPNPRQCFIPP